MKIVIIGGGFCGTTLAARILQEYKDLPIQVNLVEKNSVIGKGAAYSTDKMFHLLNVKADKMSAFPEDPTHFENWLRQKNITISSSGHMPRKLYGVYLEEILQHAVTNKPENSEFNLFQDEAIDISIEANTANILLQSGKRLEADKVILALGNYTPHSFPFQLPEAHYCNDPWTCNALDRLAENKSILIIGTGLTMIDVCVSLFHKKHKGKIFSLSKHGYLPAAHLYSRTYPDFYDELKDQNTLLGMVTIIRKHLKRAKSEGYNWRSVIDSLRAYTNKLWLQLSNADRKRFMKKLNRAWNISRHRIPPEYNQIVQKMIINQNLKVHEGKIISLEYKNNQIEVTYKKREAQDVSKLYVDFVLNCTGPQANYTQIDQPLVKNLLNKNTIEPGNLSMGIKALENGSVYVHGIPSGIVYTLGPPLLGTLFETTAVPELREQVKNLSRLLLKDYMLKNKKTVYSK